MKVSDNFWNLLAPIYEKLRRNPISGYFLRQENRAIEALFENLLSYDIKTAGDLGVGRGHSLFLLPETIPLRIALDKSLTMIQLTRKDSPDTQFINANVLNIPVKNATFDLIFCIGVVEYISDLESLFTQLNGILKNEGHLLLSYSPKNIFTSFRFFRGHWIYPREWQEIEKYIQKYQFELSDLKITPLQHQCLLKKIN